MRLELPVRIPVAKTLVFGAAMVCVQQIEHTSLIFSLFFFAFVVIANLAFNAGGGFSRASGAYVFLFAALTTVIGVSWKAFLGEPADSNLLLPELDMACYTASMVMLLVVILVNRKITGKARGMASGDIDYNLAALGCLVLGTIQTTLNSLGAGGPGSLLGIVNQLSQFVPLAIILGTIGAIKNSGGRRSVNFINGLALSLSFIGGTLSFSKQGMLTPIACWLVGAAFMRLRLRPVHLIVIVAFVVFAFTLAPTIAEGRQSAKDGDGYSQRLQLVYYILTHLKEARQQEAETNEHLLEVVGRSGYYNAPQGFIERLSMLSVDDTFFNYTNKGNYIGYEPVILDYENFIPHVLMPDKPPTIGGNYYAHQIGGFLADADDSTGISFSPVAEAYHIDGWIGIFLLLPAIWLSLFASVDYICGDLRRSPWGLLVVVIFSHQSAEGLLGALIWISGYGNLGLILAILFCTQFAPIVGALFAGGNRFAERHSAPLDFSGSGVRTLADPLIKNPNRWIP